jgi:hypothetical protein
VTFALGGRRSRERERPHEGLRYLEEGRLRILECHEDDGVLVAEARGEGRLYSVTHDAEGWACGCAARVENCAHVLACKAVTVLRPPGDIVRAGPIAAAQAQQILDRAARRLLDARLDRDAVGPSTAGIDGRARDQGADQSAALVERQQVPVASANGDRGRGGRG